MELFHTYGMPGRWFSELFDVAAGQNGFVTSGDVRNLGGSNGVLVDLERHGHLERVERGLYRFVLFPTDPRDELMAAVLWPKDGGVISHDSALDLWELCDVNPTAIHLTVPKSERLRRRIPAGYVVYRRHLEPDDLATVDGIATVTPLRAILDGMERGLDGRLIAQGIDTATRHGLILADEQRALGRSAQ